MNELLRYGVGLYTTSDSITGIEECAKSVDRHLTSDNSFILNFEFLLEDGAERIPPTEKTST